MKIFTIIFILIVSFLTFSCQTEQTVTVNRGFGIEFENTQTSN